VTTQTLDSPRTSDADEKDKFFHYVRKNKVAESAVLGTMVQALCGEIFPVTRAAKPGSPVCARCQEIYESLPAGGGS
jgi:formylmethanofuran dehydrogenase subunit E